MRNCKAGRWGAVVAAVLCMCAIGQGTTHAVTLEALFAGDTIPVGNLLFHDWALLDPNPPLGPNLAQIEVSPLNVQPLGLKFTANGQLLAVNGGSIELNFTFQVQVPSTESSRLSDNTLELTDHTLTSTNPNGPSGLVDVAESVLHANGNSLGNKEVSVDTFSGSFILLDAVTFGPQLSLTVQTFISVSADRLGDIASINMFEQRFSQSQIPEPATITLFGLGLAGLGCMAWWRRKAKAPSGTPGVPSASS